MTSRADKELTLAIQAVLDYLYEDERRHYEECPPKERPGHIFESLETLRSAVSIPGPAGTATSGRPKG